MTSPIVEDIKIAASGVRLAVDAVLAGKASTASCRACSSEYYFLGRDGLVATEAELCPACESTGGTEHGIAISVADLHRMAADRRGLLAVAGDLAATGKTEFPDAVRYLEGLVATQPRLGKLLHLARDVCGDDEEIWRAAFTAYNNGLAGGASASPTVARMARRQSATQPKAVVRIILRLAGKIIYDGPVDAPKIRALEIEHGRKIKATLYHMDGTRSEMRGERDSKSDTDDAAMLGARAMLAPKA